MHIGSVTMRAIVEIDALETPPEFFVGDITPEEAARHGQALGPRFFDMDRGLCRVSQHAWLIEADGCRILVDPCVGHQRNRPSMPMFHQIDSPLLDRLALLGVAPESIDYVFCTHLHLDHVGWNTRLQDGRFVPTFPNARYLFSRTENDYWHSQKSQMLPGEEYNAGVYAECIEPVIEAGLATYAEPGVRLANCLTLIEAPGHTIGHMAGLLESEGEGVVLAGDIVHHPLQVILPERPFLAYDQQQAIATRLDLLNLCALRDYWLAPAHFCAPHACKIRKNESGYEMIWPQTGA